MDSGMLKMKRTLREAGLGLATVALLLYAAMTAAKSMAGVMQDHVAVACQTGADACPPPVVVARD